MTKFGLAEVHEDGWWLRVEMTFADREEAIAVAKDWQTRKGLAAVGVADVEGLALVWRSDAGKLSLLYRGQRGQRDSIPPRSR